jgi:hypothetical protein
VGGRVSALVGLPFLLLLLLSYVAYMCASTYCEGATTITTTTVTHQELRGGFCHYCSLIISSHVPVNENMKYLS